MYGNGAGLPIHMIGEVSRELKKEDEEDERGTLSIHSSLVSKVGEGVC
jgi:hypothetical protein